MENVEKRISDLEKSIISLAKDVKEIKQSLLNGFTVIDGNFKKIDSSFKAIDKDFIIVNTKMDKLQGHTSKSFKNVDGKLDGLKVEIKNIGKVTGYDEMISNLKVLKK